MRSDFIQCIVSWDERHKGSDDRFVRMAGAMYTCIWHVTCGKSKRLVVALLDDGSHKSWSSEIVLWFFTCIYKGSVQVTSGLFNSFGCKLECVADAWPTLIILGPLHICGTLKLETSNSACIKDHEGHYWQKCKIRSKESWRGHVTYTFRNKILKLKF